MNPSTDPDNATDVDENPPHRVDVRPHPHLRSMVVQNYHGYPRTDTPHVHHSLRATAAVRLVIKLADSPLRPPEFLVGALDRHLPIDGACAPSYIELMLDPLGAYTLLGTPGSEISGRMADFADVIGQRHRTTAERIRDQRTWRTRFDMLDALLLERAQVGRRPLPQIRRAWSLLNRSGGTIPISRIAHDVGWSHKHLITKFTDHIGLTPKVSARLIRFDRVHRQLVLGPRPLLHNLATDFGYADQSHLNREFRKFTGTTPTRILEQVAAAQRNPTEPGTDNSSDPADHAAGS